MSNNIQKVIEEGVNGVDDIEQLKMQVERWACDADCYVDREKIKSHIRTTISNVLQAIEEEVGKKMKETDGDSRQAIIWKQGHNIGLAKFAALLKSARDSVK